MSLISLQQQLRLGMKLTPQQVQYLKLLQLPTLALEQRIKMELEQNPMLDIGEEEELELTQEEPETDSKDGEETAEEPAKDDYTLEDYIKDESSGYKSPEASRRDDEDDYESPLPASVPLVERLMTQFRMLDVDPDDEVLAEEILGNIDEDGYLRRDLSLIVQDLNLTLGLSITQGRAEEVLRMIQRLEPPGVGSRSLQECLASQLRASNTPEPYRELALRIVCNHFEDLRQRRFEILQRALKISQATLKKVLEFIQRMNPKPGEGEFSAQENYITPDFVIERDDGDFLVLLNDRTIPPLRINNAYKAIAAPKGKHATPEAKDFVRKKFEAAKWFIASIHQRRATLLRVMNAIVRQQRQWFEEGEVLKPMIYKDVADVVSVDISTISRVVNSKYVQTEFGVYPLRYFFTSGLSSESGEDVSNTAVKAKIRDLITGEDPKRPLNDDSIAKVLNDDGIHIARRTVAKYREALGIPIARLRVKI